MNKKKRKRKKKYRKIESKTSILHKKVICHMENRKAIEQEK